MHEKEAKVLLSSQNGMNIYRGCTHGCIYCDSRSKCYQMDFAFEDIEVKSNAVTLLEKALKSKRKKCMIGTGSMSDPYMHCEEKIQHMRKCLELIEQYGFGVALQTKSDLCKIIEPNVCTTKRRAEVLNIMRDNGIPTVVWLDPILPFINDTKENLMGILTYCKEAKVRGIICFSMGLTLRDGNREYFYQKLDEHFPGLKSVYQKKFGQAYEIYSEHNKEMMAMFHAFCKENNIESDVNRNFAYLHEFEDKLAGKQMSLFEL